MNSFLSKDEISQIGFKNVGENVFLSRHAKFYQAEKMSIGDNVRIDDFCILSGRIDIGDYIHIAAFSALYGGGKGIFIDDYANISSRVVIYAKSDDYSGETMTNPMVPDMYKEITEKSVDIGKHVIIGSGCIVLPGSHLLEGSAFGSMTLINRNSRSWSVNVGIPFKKIKDRSKKILKLEQEFIEEKKNE